MTSWAGVPRERQPRRMWGLSEVQIEEVRRSTRTLLDRTGIEVQHERLRRLAARAGARIDETSRRVRIPPQLLAELVGRCPRQYEIAGAGGGRHIVGGETAGCTAIVTDPWVVDYATGAVRRPGLDDVRRHTRIAEGMDEVVCISLMDYPVTDVEGPDSSLRAMEEHLLNHDKHIQVMPASVASLERWLGAGRLLLGGEELAGSRLMSVGVAVRSPLVLTPLNAELLLTACEHDLPVVPTTCPMAGSTAPYSKAGTLLLGNAESVAMAALTQMVRPGHPYLYAYGPSTTDMRTGQDLYYTLDKVLWKVAGAQLGASYGLPTVAECGGTMAARYDLQSGAEGMLFMAAAWESGADMLAGIGSCGNAVTMSGEMMLVHRAWLQAARFLSAGIDTGDPTVAGDIERVGPGGQYLSDGSTLERLRAGEFFGSGLFAYEGHPGGGQSLVARCHREAEELVAGFSPPLDGDRQEALRRFFQEERDGLAGR